MPFQTEEYLTASSAPITANSFSHAFLRPLYVITSNFTWFTVLSVSFVIGQRNYFGFGFKALGNGHIVADTDVSPFARARNICCGHEVCVRDTKNVSDFVQKHFVSVTNVSQFARARKRHELTMFSQQCFLVCHRLYDTQLKITTNHCILFSYSSVSFCLFFRPVVA